MEFDLNHITTLPPKDKTKKETKTSLTGYCRSLFELQNKFYADNRYSMLIVLQGMDTSGKDGTIRHVMSCMNPQGVQVKSFKAPTIDEQKHDFLWRIYSEFPERGMIKVFNRSYYEDILVPGLNGQLSKELFQHRVNLINELEHHLLTNNTIILKFYLHLSRDIQLKRIAERKTKPHKRWKYRPEDEVTPLIWNTYIDIYQQLISKCSLIPWYIVPSDKRWFRNYFVAKVLKDQLEQLNLKYPE